VSVVVEERPTQRRLVIRAGYVWMSHRELALLQGRKPVTCGGDIRFVYTNGPMKEAHCDECSFSVAATEESVRSAAIGRERLEKAAKFNREAWWQQ
jgi:hypothetical protein